MAKEAATALSLLISKATPEVMERVSDLLGLDDPERLALLIARELNPAHIFTEEEEARMRGVSAKTLRGMKQKKEVPPVL